MRHNGFGLYNERPNTAIGGILPPQKLALVTERSTLISAIKITHREIVTLENKDIYNVVMQNKIFRFHNGVILMNSNCEKSHFLDETGASIGDLMQIPSSFWMLDKNSETRIINSEGIKVCGYRSEKDALGNSVLPVSKKESALELIGNCESVMKTGELKIVEENYIRKDGLQQQFLSIKLPWYDLDKGIIGVCGFSIVLGVHSLADNLSILTRHGLIGSGNNTTPSNIALHKLPALPLREKECLHYIMQGYTAKMIARELNLSYRTVESYIDNLKSRCGVTSKHELIKLFR